MVAEEAEQGTQTSGVLSAPWQSLSAQEYPLLGLTQIRKYDRHESIGLPSNIYMNKYTLICVLLTVYKAFLTMCQVLVCTLILIKSYFHFIDENDGT